MQALHNFKTYFLRGLAALLPTILTVWIFVQLYLFIQHNVSAHINRAVVRILVYSTPNYPYIDTDELSAYVKKNYPAAADNPQTLAEKMDESSIKREVRIEKATKFWVYGHGQITGFIIAFLAVVFIGAFLASVIGRAVWRMFEHILMKTPLLKEVYPSIKQITDFFFAGKKMAFNKVVALEYPRKGVWTIGMVTGGGIKKLAPEGTELLTVFVPTSPSPVNGFVLVLPKSEVIDMDVSIEEALRFIISSGVISPSVFQSYSQEQKDVLLKNE
ncbi:MAG: DUF502 domain-containing protein [Sedimentisphaerales bacterium]